MNCVKMEQLISIDYHIINVFAMNQCWENNHVFDTVFHTGRPTSALLYVEDCTAEYILDNNKRFFVKKGEIVYIPQGAKYKTVFHHTIKGKTSSMLIEFTTTDLSGMPFVFCSHIMKLSDVQGINKTLFIEIISLYLSPVQSLAMIKSILYKFLSELSDARRLKNINSKEFSQIAKGILYLENNISFDKSIAEIATMCHVSTSCFRRLFKKYSGLSPVQYQIGVKVDYAKKLLLSNTMTVSEISERLGFQDLSYFCKFFKKQTGTTAKEYLALNKK
ncbi:AraC family transcriptional regulator [Congzhengia sp.]|uniref:AraC family transcriptional regulator n=1 Tax=Congzhengia sp. TaxID=2944168 RepID=UPI003077E8C4